MKKICILFLIILPTCLFADYNSTYYSDLVINSDKVLIGKIIAVDSTHYSLRVEEVFFGEDNEKVIRIEKWKDYNHSWMPDFDYRKKIGHKVFLFLKNNRTCDNGGNEAEIFVKNDSVHYEGVWSVKDFAGIFLDCRNNVDTIKTFSRNQEADFISSFKKKSSLHELFIEKFPWIKYIPEEFYLDPVVSVEKTIFLYEGVPNKIDISIPGIFPDKIISAKVDSGKIQGERGRYIVTPYKISKLKMTFIYINGKDTIEDNYLFPVNKLPVPFIGMTGKKSGDKIPKSIFNIGPYTHLYAKFPFTLDIDTRLNVVSFCFKVEINGKTIVIENNSSIISKKIIDLVNTLDSGAKIYFENIKVKTTQGDILEALPGYFEME